MPVIFVPDHRIAASKNETLGLPHRGKLRCGFRIFRKDFSTLMCESIPLIMIKAQSFSMVAQIVAHNDKRATVNFHQTRWNIFGEY